MSTQKNHERAPGMTQTSIAIPTDLLARLSREAKTQRRSRNNLIALLLEDGVETFEQMHTRDRADAQPQVAPADTSHYKMRRRQEPKK